MKKYIVIGGQYQQCYYGESDSIRGAKQIASRHLEYWDDWQGWHYPGIYATCDCITIDNGEIIHDYGAAPIFFRIYGGKWVEFKAKKRLRADIKS